MLKTGTVSGRDGGAPSASGPAWQPRYPGEEGGSKGVRDQLAARSQDQGNRVEVSAHRFAPLPADCSTPVPGMSGRTSTGRVWRDSFRAVAELRRVLIGEWLGRVATAVPNPAQPGPAGPINRARRCGTGHPMLCTCRRHPIITVRS
jgi:hypothetical protein